jgi:hypothetical protein
MSHSKSTLLVMLLHRPEFIKEFGATTWAVFQEVHNLYRAADPTTSFSMFRLISQDSENLLSMDDGQQLLVPTDLWNAAWGRYSGTIDHCKLVPLVRQLLPRQDGSPPMLVITDEELTPPEGFRYLMWMESKTDGGTVLSLPTLDPQSWMEVSPNFSSPQPTTTTRKAITKRRVRAASLSIVGSILGLKRCEKPNCFLYKETTSVVSIDQLVQLGSEHAGELPNIDVVLGASFPYESPNPEKVDALIVNTPRGKIYAA